MFSLSWRFKSSILPLNSSSLICRASSMFITALSRTFSGISSAICLANSAACAVPLFAFRVGPTTVSSVSKTMNLSLKNGARFAFHLSPSLMSIRIVAGRTSAVGGNSIPIALSKG